MCTTPSTAQAGEDAGISWSYSGGGGGLDLQIWDLNRAHETETTVFPIHRFSACVDADYDIKEHRRTGLEILGGQTGICPTRAKGAKTSRRVRGHAPQENFEK